MMILSSPSVRNKLLIFSALLVVSLGSMLGVLAERNGRRTLERVIGRQLAREAGHVADRLETLVRSERETLESFARQDVMRQIRVADVDKRIAQTLFTLASGAEVRVGYFVTEVSGQVIAASEPRWLIAPPEIPPGSAGAPGSPSRVLGLIPGTDGSARLVIATPIPDPDRPIDPRAPTLGVLYGVLDWQALTSVMDRVRLELEAQDILAEIAIADAQGELLRFSSPPNTTSADGRRFASSVRDIADTPDYRVDELAGRITGRARLQIGEQPWSLLVIEPLAHALAPAVRLRNRIGLTTALVLFFALGLAAISADRVVRPLTELTTAIGEVSRGDLASARVAVRSNDEVGTLAAAFNQMASDLDEAQRHLVEAEKFAFVGELAAGVAHEVRTSLGVLRSSAQMLERSLPDTGDAEAREMIGMIGAEVERLSGVVDDLLHLDQRRPLDLGPTSLTEPLEAAIAFVSRQAEEAGIEITKRFAGEAPIVHCDSEAIQQVCINLLSNAIASLSRGDHIEVEIAPSGPRHARFVIRDDGPGIPEALRARIFDPFVTGRATGVGLGLTFVKRVLHGHHGRIELQSEPGAGACFVVELPLWRNAA